MKLPRFVWWLLGIGGAVGVAYWLWSKREVNATVWVPQDEIVIGKVRTTEELFREKLQAEGIW